MFNCFRTSIFFKIFSLIDFYYFKIGCLLHQISIPRIGSVADVSGGGYLLYEGVVIDY